MALKQNLMEEAHSCIVPKIRNIIFVAAVDIVIVVVFAVVVSSNTRVILHIILVISSNGSASHLKDVYYYKRSCIWEGRWKFLTMNVI